MAPKPAQTPTCQAAVIAFLRDGAGQPRLGEPVEVRETHGALVFLIGDSAYKLKKAVRFEYLDFSTAEKRRAMLARELDLNRPFAPEIYLAVLPVTRASDGALALGGAGEVADYVLHMRRFPEADVLASRARAGLLTPDVARAVADVVLASHRDAPMVTVVDGDGRAERVLRDVGAQLAELSTVLPASQVTAFRTAASAMLERTRRCLRARGQSGHVRRCHGDLHLNNIVSWRGNPVLFDALEFDEALATIDTMYDLAFLLMDLDHHQLRSAANIVLNRYLWRSGDASDLEALQVLPLFLGLRSAIRAMTTAQRAVQLDLATPDAPVAAARSYLDDAIGYLSPPLPRLIAVGGPSGSGKSTVAAALAPLLAPAPGALHLRTDLERKALFGVGETDRLPAEGYSAAATARTYAVTIEKAAVALAAGHAVIVDAAFQRPDDRARVEAVARACEVRFTGLWLTAPPEILIARVNSRQGDASDATQAVVESQIAKDPGAISWEIVDASGRIDATIAAARLSADLA